jgi:hypothetical protein
VAGRLLPAPFRIVTSIDRVIRSGHLLDTSVEIEETRASLFASAVF